MIEPVDTTQVVFDPLEILRALTDGGVEFVVIGGIAALLHGDDAGTSDVDATISDSRENLQALADALVRLRARLLVTVNRTDEAVIDVPVTADTFTSLTSARLLTRHGVLDVVLRPDGLTTFRDWRTNATLVDVGEGTQVHVAALHDVIRSKEAAGRAKDRQALPRLRALRDLIERRSD